MFGKKKFNEIHGLSSQMRAMVLVIFCSIVAERARNSVSRSLRSMRIRASVSFIPRVFYPEESLFEKRQSTLIIS